MCLTHIHTQTHAHTHTHCLHLVIPILLLFREIGLVDTSLQLFPVSPEKPPTPLVCLVCALWSLILIIKLSLQHEPLAANSGALGSSALNQSNWVLHWRTFPLFFSSGHFDSPFSHFHNYASPFSNGVKMLYLLKLYTVKTEYLNSVAPWTYDLALEMWQ